MDLTKIIPLTNNWAHNNHLLNTNIDFLITHLVTKIVQYKFSRSLVKTRKISKTSVYRGRKSLGDLYDRSQSVWTTDIRTDSSSNYQLTQPKHHHDML